MELHGQSARAVWTAPLEQPLDSRRARPPGWRPTLGGRQGPGRGGSIGDSQGASPTAAPSSWSWAAGRAPGAVAQPGASPTTAPSGYTRSGAAAGAVAHLVSLEGGGPPGRRGRRLGAGRPGRPGPGRSGASSEPRWCCMG
jgi:hypothetical protein